MLETKESKTLTSRCPDCGNAVPGGSWATHRRECGRPKGRTFHDWLRDRMKERHEAECILSLDDLTAVIRVCHEDIPESVKGELAYLAGEQYRIEQRVAALLEQMV